MGTATVPESRGPDWSAQTEEIFCPLCDYNLRGLIEPRCPECGHEFEWERLLDPNQRVHPYIFEHHPTRNIWSYCRTVRGALRPRLFWKSIHPAQPSCVRRLFLFWLIGTAIVFAVPTSRVGFDLYRFTVLMRESRNRDAAIMGQMSGQQLQPTIQNFGSINSYLDYFYPQPPSKRFFQMFLHDEFRGIGAHPEVLMTLAYLIWPWAAAGVLMIFRASMQKAKIRSSHVLRCTIYSADIGLPWLADLAGIAVIAVGMMTCAGVVRISPRFFISADLMRYAWWSANLVLWLGVTYRLIRAYRDYLRFDHAVATVFCVQGIIVLAFACIALYAFDYYDLMRLIFFGP